MCPDRIIASRKKRSDGRKIALECLLLAACRASCSQLAPPGGEPMKSSCKLPRQHLCSDFDCSISRHLKCRFMPTAAAGVGQLSRLACIGRSGRRNRLCILRFCGQRQLRAAVVRLACGPTANPALGSSRRAPQSPVSFWCSIYESPCWRAERSRPALHPPLPPARPVRAGSAGTLRPLLMLLWA